MRGLNIVPCGERNEWNAREGVTQVTWASRLPPGVVGGVYWLCCVTGHKEMIHSELDIYINLEAEITKLKAKKTILKYLR